MVVVRGLSKGILARNATPAVIAYTPFLLGIKVESDILYSSFKSNCLVSYVIC